MKYEIAISFAEEDRNIAVALSCGFKLKKLKAYYYPDYKEEMIGNDLPKKLKSLYKNEAKFAIIILSKYYLSKRFCQLELNAIKQRAEISSTRYLVIVKTDEILPQDIGLSNDIVYEEWKYNPEEIAECFKKVLGKKSKPENKNPFSIFSTKANTIKNQVNVQKVKQDLNINN